MARVVNCSQELRSRARISAAAPLLILAGAGVMFAAPVQGFLLLFAGVALLAHQSRSRAVYISGIRGEEEVVRELSGLDDRFLVLNNYRIGRRGDIDHIVVGPKGIFVIETKNLRGTVSFRNGRFEYIKRGRRGGTYPGNASDPVAQVQRNAVRLRRLLTRRADGKLRIPYVRALVVFASETHISGEPPREVPVLRPWELGEYIMSQKDVLGWKRQHRIERLLLPPAPSSRHAGRCRGSLARASS
ncbi:MAG: NERD domain-containing protein [Euryarchaeota archaeon]|nr:NERD domain-containing protein [Euryarchaeota archaeon]